MSKSFDKPAVARHSWFIEPFSFGLTIDGRSTPRSFAKSLPVALRRLAEDCRHARELLAEHPGASGDHRPHVVLLGDDEHGYVGRINLPPTLTEESLEELLPEIEAHARAPFDEAMRLTRRAIINREVH